jgi:hypothetical protein
LILISSSIRKKSFLLKGEDCENVGMLKLLFVSIGQVYDDKLITLPFLTDLSVYLTLYNVVNDGRSPLTITKRETMKSKSTIHKLLVTILLLGLLLSACSPKAPAATPTPSAPDALEATIDMGVLETQVAETVYAEVTQAALLLPSETPLPPTDTVVAATLIPTNTSFVLSTNTAQPAVVLQTNTTIYPTYTPYYTETPEDQNFRCAIINQTIAYDEVMFSGEEFEAGWTIENKGKAYWSDAGIDIVYVSGTKMQTVSSRYDLGQDVPPTGNVSFSISMRAPSTPGTYDAYWTFQGDPGTFCPLYVRIKVE